MKHLDNGQNCNSRKQRNTIIPHKERGVVAIIVALSMVVLVGFVGLALDLGKLFVTKTELQNSADACALAAARELTGANDNQLTLAEIAGIAAGTSNNVIFQGESVVINEDNNITFSDLLNGTYVTKFIGSTATNMKFVRCTVTKTGIPNWFMQVLGIGGQDVRATAVASLHPGQTACAIPVALCETELTGKVAGDWVSTLLEPGEGLSGDFLWASVVKDAKTIKDILSGSGSCDTPATGENVGSPGSMVGVYNAWNTRFGVYQGSFDINNAEPDLTGFAYTAKSWSSCERAFVDGDFMDKRAKNTPFQDPSLDATGLKVAPPAKSSTIAEHGGGGDRRLVAIPVIDCAALAGDPSDPKNTHQTPIKSWACVLMLHPLDQNPAPEASACPGKTGNRAFLEYLGPANVPGSPCATTGAVGGKDSTGPLVPALVQ